MTILTVEQARKIYEGAVIREGAVICKGALIREGAVISEGALIREGAVISEGSFIGVGRKNVNKNMVISGLGETKNITAYTCDDGLIVNIGCVNDYAGLDSPKMRELIAEKYELDHEYFLAMDLIEKWYKNLNK